MFSQVQQSVVVVHEDKMPVGSVLMAALNATNAALSPALHVTAAAVLWSPVDIARRASTTISTDVVVAI